MTATVVEKIKIKHYEMMLLSSMEETMFLVDGIWYKTLPGYWEADEPQANLLEESTQEVADLLLAKIKKANDEYVWENRPSSDTRIDHFTAMWDKFPYHG